MLITLFRKHPLAIFIQTKTSCNARCVNCPHSFTYLNGPHKKGAMKDRIWLKILRDIHEMKYKGQVGLYLHYEPLTDSTLFDKIKDIHKQTKAFVVLSINGGLLTPKNIEKLIHTAPRQVHITVNSVDPRQYEGMMKMPFERNMRRIKDFIAKAGDKIRIEINVPVLPGVDTRRIEEYFNPVWVNKDFYANSRGGLLPSISVKGYKSRFKINSYCKQPEQNFCILHDGSVILCCTDWMHVTKKYFPNVLGESIYEIYNSDIMKSFTKRFKKGDYSCCKMCSICAKEMGFNSSV